MQANREEVHRAILRAIEESGRAIGAKQIGDALHVSGLHLQPRTVRLRLLETDRLGFTRLVSRRAGRALTPRGSEELRRGDVLSKVGFVAARIDSLVCRMSFDLRRTAGTIVSNLATIPRGAVARALQDMKPVFARRLGMGHLVRLSPDPAQADRMALATVCSITVNGALLKQGIPLTSRFGGLLEMREGRPVRFVEIIEYRGSTLDPLEVFIQAGMTRVRDCARTGTGVIGASFREFPSVATDAVHRVRAALERAGLGGILLVGRPGLPVLDVPVGEGRSGLIVLAGLNPVAALREAGVGPEIRSLAGLAEYAAFTPFEIVRNRWPHAGSALVLED